MDSMFVLLVAFFVAIIAYWVIRSKSRRTPPGPIGLPIVGYIPFMSSKPYLDLDKLAKTYGQIFSLRLGSQYVIVLNDFPSMKEAFAQDAFMGRPPESPFDLNKETIETEAFNGLPWKEQRRFSLHMLRDLGFGKPRMEELMKDEIHDLLEYFEKSEGKPINARPLLAPSMSNNIATLVFGKRLKFDDPVRKMLDRTLSESAKAAGQVTWQLFFPWLKKTLQFLGIGEVDKISKILKEMRAYMMKEIDAHEKTLDSNNIRDYIDGYLLEIQKRNDPAFSKAVLQDMIGGFFGAGSETVRVTIEWLILTMAAYNDVQKRVQSEIDNVIGRDRLVTWADHIIMPYTMATITELMRWRTIVPINPLRYTLTDTEVGGYFIPKHSYILGNIWAAHHNPKYWGQDAEIFRPERFLTEDGKEVKKSEYFIPFSTGKRACPGKPLAKVEVFLYFVSILQNFNVALPEGKIPNFDGDLGIALTPKIYEVCLTKRT